MSDSLYAVVEFPPDRTCEKPQAAIVLTSWLLPDNKCWWSCHLKNDVAIQKALISQQEPGAGYMKYTFLRILHEYNKYKDARLGLRKSEIISDLESNKEESFISSRGRHIKRKFELYEDNEEDDSPPKKTSVKAPPVFSFPNSDSESSMDQAHSKTKSQACSVEKKRKSVEKTSKKISNSHLLKKDKLCKNICKVVKKQGVIRAELASASRLKQRLSLQEYDTSMKLNKKKSTHIFTEMSRELVKAPSASPSKQSTSCREAREKSPLDQNSRAHTASPSLLEQRKSYNVIAETHMSASQSPVSSQSVNDLNVDVSSSSLIHSNIADSSMSEFDIEDSNVENSQRNNHGDECAHSSSDNNYTGMHRV